MNNEECEGQPRKGGSKQLCVGVTVLQGESFASLVSLLLNAASTNFSNFFAYLDKEIQILFTYHKLWFFFLVISQTFLHYKPFCIPHLIIFKYISSVQKIVFSYFSFLQETLKLTSFFILPHWYRVSPETVLLSQKGRKTFWKGIFKLLSI